ncbi:hypothetical protein ACWIDJ_11850 [Brevundimonas naejangsanensis]
MPPHASATLSNGAPASGTKPSRASFWSQPNAMIQQGEIGKALMDVTPQHIADLKRIVENMDKIIAAEKADAAS